MGQLFTFKQKNLHSEQAALMGLRWRLIKQLAQRTILIVEWLPYW